MKKGAAALLSVIMLTLMVSLTGNAAFSYQHDPMENPKAAEDIIVNPNAVYGYSPSPDSTRLKEFIDYDWTDEAVVNNMRQKREEYHLSMSALYEMKKSMMADGKSTEEIARALSAMRNQLRLESYANDPEGLAKVKQSNLETYGNENGGTPEFFYEKYGSWETVIEKTMASNPGADACLGLYDKYYDTYEIANDGASTGTQAGAPAGKTSPAPKMGDTDTEAYLLMTSLCALAVLTAAGRGKTEKRNSKNAAA